MAVEPEEPRTPSRAKHEQREPSVFGRGAHQLILYGPNSLHFIMSVLSIRFRSASIPEPPPASPFRTLQHVAPDPRAIIWMMRWFTVVSHHLTSPSDEPELLRVQANANKQTHGVISATRTDRESVLDFRYNDRSH